jgi:hypothetical protein
MKANRNSSIKKICETYDCTTANIDIIIRENDDKDYPYSVVLKYMLEEVQDVQKSLNGDDFACMTVDDSLSSVIERWMFETNCDHDEYSFVYKVFESN